LNGSASNGALGCVVQQVYCNLVAVNNSY